MQETNQVKQGRTKERRSSRQREYRAIAFLLVLGLGVWMVQSAVYYCSSHEHVALVPLLDYVTSREMIISLVGIVCFLGYGLYVSRMVADVKRAEEEQEELISVLSEAKEALYYQATHDGLSGLWNRTTILDRLERELNNSRAKGTTLAVIIGDIDNFKRINDEHGHLVGDSVLQEVAERIAQSVRADDFVGRYGGEEFICVLPDSDERKARRIAERLRFDLSSAPIETSEGDFEIAMSFGVAIGDGSAWDVDAMVRAADKALYRAKNGGRNRVEVCQEEDFR